ncbi:MAG: DNA-binding protein [Gammaproteobacteria bacterium SHHR-1]|uniref:FitA-like ribbon-helix-helix domain-containing protein n=1 Tax=Magnetovirga frankeli TaxID=947516 RepID=UPI001293B4CE|nr:DNA-binding protein [gamma proteobacterium SS-5]
MANLVVRNLDPTVVAALKQRASRHGRSTEAEHRALLEEVLLHPRPKSFAEVLLGIPDVGRDEDFVRQEDKMDAARVFD